MNNVLRRAKEVRDKLIVKKTEYQSFIDRLTEVEFFQKNLVKKHSEDVDLIGLDTKVAEVVKVIFDETSIDGRDYLEKLIDNCLQSVFIDEDYKIDIRSSSRGSERTAEFWVNDGLSINPISECGDGLNAVVSFVIRIYTILKTKSKRIIIVDEGFSNLSPQYLDPLMGFFKMLVKDFQFKFLLISHHSLLQETGFKKFEVYDGVLYERK